MKKFILIISLLFMSSTQAAIVSLDWKTTGDNLITRDTVSGLNWLDLTETNNMSYDYIIGQLGIGGQFAGYRYATNSEVVGLWSNFGVDLSANQPVSASEPDPKVMSAALVLGNIMNEKNSYFPAGAIGVTSEYDYTRSGTHYRMGAINTPSDTIYYLSGKSLQFDNTAGVDIGSYLVATSAVPIPSALWLFGSGLIGLIGLARRKTNA